MVDKSKLSKSKRAKSNQILRTRGLSVGDVVLPWEFKDAFKQLHRELTEELSPDGRAQEEVVFSLAIWHWRKYQLLKMLRTAALKDPFFIELKESGRKSWSGIRKYLLEQEEGYKTIRGMLSNLVSKFDDELMKELAHDPKGMEKEEFEGREQKLSDMTKAMSEHLLPMLQAIDAGPSAEKTFEQAYSPESLERVLKCEAAIDARIDKLLGRLVSLKEYQRMYGAHAVLPLPPKIKSPPSAAELAELTAG